MKYGSQFQTWGQRWAVWRPQNLTLGNFYLKEWKFFIQPFSPISTKIPEIHQLHFPQVCRNSETCWWLYSEVFKGKPYSLYQGVPLAQCCSSSHPAPYNGVKTLFWTEYPDFHVQYDENMIDTVPSLKVCECARIICRRLELRPGCRLVISPDFISVEIFDRQLKWPQF